MSSYTLNELAMRLNGSVVGNKDQVVDSFATLERAKPNQLTFLANPKYISQLKTTKAGGVLISKDALPICPTNAIIIDNPYFAFALIGKLFDRSPKSLPGIHSSAEISSTAEIPASASIAQNVVIGNNTKIGENVIIGANSVILDNCEINNNTVIKQNVTIHHDVKLGLNCMIHSGVVIGGDGFGNAKDSQGNWIKIPQLGGVTCGDNVEIGSNSTIDRGAIDDTVLSSGVKIDNLVQIAHNVEIGQNTACAAQVGIAGSTKVGSNCLFGGQVGVAGHLEIADGVMLGAATTTSRSLKQAGAYMSQLEALPHMQWKRILSKLSSLPNVDKRLKRLEK